VLIPGGVENSIGIISAGYIKDPTDPQFQKGKEWDDFVAFMKKYHPTGAMNDNFNVYGYTVAQNVVHVLQKSGDTLTRENIMKQAASMDLVLPMLLPGVNVKTGPDDFFPIEREQLMKFDGKTWQLFGKVYGR
jgi:branched-chain amino acid transport system substrate-binding protein